MSDDDVHRGDMHELPPEQLDRLVDEPLAHPGQHRVVRSLGQLGAALRAVDAPTPGPELAEFLDVDAAQARLTDTDQERRPVLLGTLAAPTKEKTMFASIATLAATAAGKVVLGTAAAAAAVGGAQVTGVIDLSPDDRPVSLQVAQQPEVSQPPLEFPAADAGTVTVFLEDGDLVVLGIDSADGWTGGLDPDPDLGEIEVRFLGAEGGVVSIEVKIRNGIIEVEVLDELGVETTMYFDLDGTPLPGDPFDDSDDDNSDSDGDDEEDSDDSDDDDESDGDDESDDDDEEDSDDSDDDDDDSDDPDDSDDGADDDADSDDDFDDEDSDDRDDD